MASNYKKLGEYISEVDKRNSDLSLGENDLFGISVSKEFITTHANLVGVSFDNYKVVNNRNFAYISDTSRRGDKIAISLNDKDKNIIVSSICTVFQINDETKLLPEYLILWFMRPEFDRYARFMSNGSARETFDWECMCGVELPVPSIEEQRKIVHDYKVITDRIELLKKINENLDETLVNHFFSLELNDSKTIKELTKNSIGVRTGKSPQDSNDSKNSKFQYPIIGASGIMGYTSLHLYDGRVVSTGRVGTIGKVMLWENRNWFTDNSLVIESEYIATIYSALKTFNFGEITGGSSNPKITQTDLNESKVSIPNSESIAKFELFAKPIIDLIFTNKKEIISLENLSQVLLSNISREVA